MKKNLLFIFAFLTTFCLNAQDVVITEIMYNPPESGQDAREFIELYNNGDALINMEGYSLSGVNFTFPASTLAPGEYVVLAADAVVLQSELGVTAMAWEDGSLSNGGETIKLFDAAGVVVDSVDYDDGSGWPVEADGDGASLVLCDFNSDNNDPANWQAASTATGVIVNEKEIFANPGAESGCLVGVVSKFIQTSAEVDEDAGVLSFGIQYPPGDFVATELTITLDVMASTATQGSDFMFMDTTLMVASMMTDTAYFNVEIIDDMDVESVEQIVLTLSSSNSTVDPLNATLTIEISDNDADVPNLVINEIFYNIPGDGEAYEFIEIYNASGADVQMEGYSFSAGVPFTFPNYTLAADAYVVVAVDSVNVEDKFGVTAFQWGDGGLSNGGETIELQDNYGNVVDMVQYDDGGDWPADADGGGSSLILCDPATDNEVGTNWNASMEDNGVIINGNSIFASPGVANDCDATANPTTDYPVRTIGEMTMVDMEGVADSLDRLCQIQGVVYGVNLNPNGLQFTIIDEFNDGIALYSGGDTWGYTVAEGDEVVVQGAITQFNGLTQISPDSLWMVSADNTLVDADEVTALNEDTESQLVALVGVMIDDPAQWTGTGSGFNFDVSDGTNTYAVRIDADVDLYSESVANYEGQVLKITGLGGQFDSSSPATEGYQLLPRYQADIQILESTNDIPVVVMDVFPNPATTMVNIVAEEALDGYFLQNVQGQTLRSDAASNTNYTVDVANLPSGVYFINFVKGNKTWAQKIVVE